MWPRALDIIREATKAVPAVRYALGIAGIMAALALGASFFKDVQTAVFGTLVMIGLMVLLLVFAAAAAQGTGPFRVPALAMTWAITVLFIASATLTISAVFFDRPKPFPVLIQQLWGASTEDGTKSGSTGTPRSFEVHAYAIGERVRTTTVDNTVERRSDSVNVGCEQDGKGRIVYDIPGNVTVGVHSAAWVDVDNIKSKEARSERSGEQIVATGEIRGRDKVVFDCPGGGHATLVLSVGLRETSEAAEAAPPIEIGASELHHTPVSFAAPTDGNLRVHAYRVDLRPLGSAERFATIDLPGCGGQEQFLERTLFGHSFGVRCSGRTVSVQVRSTSS